MELGLYTFADVGTDPVTGRRIGPAERLRNLVEEIVLADAGGLEVFGLGEHHRPDYAASAPAVALAGAATQTRRIRLTSAVTVLSSDDPVRVFQQFATLDALSAGRAEIMVGRGSFIESFPLFGYDLDDYDALFDEKLALLMRLNEGERVTWPGGRHTRAIEDRGVYPRPGPGEAADLGRGRRHAAVGGPGGRARACRWRSPSSAASPRASRRSSTSTAGRRRRPATIRRRSRTSINVHGFVARDEPGGGRHLLPGAGRGDEPHRPRARLAADEPGAVRRRPRAAGRAVRRQPGRGDRQDPRRPTRSSASTAS